MGIEGNCSRAWCDDGVVVVVVVRNEENVNCKLLEL